MIDLQQLIQNTCEAMASIGTNCDDTLWNNFAAEENTTVCDTLCNNLICLGVSEDFIDDFFEIDPKDENEIKEWILSCISSQKESKIK